MASKRKTDDGKFHWDFEDALSFHEMDLQVHGVNLTAKSIECVHCGKTVKLKRDFSAGYFVDHVNLFHLKTEQPLEKKGRKKRQTEFNKGPWTVEEKEIFRQMCQRGLSRSDMVREKTLKRSYDQINHHLQKNLQNYKRGNWTPEEKAIYQEMSDRGLKYSQMFKENRLNRSIYQIMNYDQKHKRKDSSMHYNKGAWNAEEKLEFRAMVDEGLSATQMFNTKRLNRTFGQIQGYFYYERNADDTTYNKGFWSAEEKEIFNEMAARKLTPPQMFQEKRLQRTVYQIMNYFHAHKSKDDQENASTNTQYLDVLPTALKENLLQPDQVGAAAGTVEELLKASQLI